MLRSEFVESHVIYMIDVCWPHGTHPLSAGCLKGNGGLLILRMELRLNRQPSTVVEQIFTHSKLRVTKTSIVVVGDILLARKDPVTPARLRCAENYHWLARRYTLQAYAFEQGGYGGHNNSTALLQVADVDT
jgi:hypothetical protein